MDKTQFRFFSFLLALFFVCCLAISETVNVETNALMEFKNGLKDPTNSLSSWKDSESPCEFLGVSCDLISGKVTEIHLENMGLSGEISPVISELQKLETFSLPTNNISGVIPSELIKCSNLRVLNLTGNDMVGAIPDLSELKNLEVLDLSINYFNGGFPSWVVNLTSLVSLGLGENEFEESEISQSLGNLKNLTWLYLADSNLTGEIPESFYQMKQLKTLDLSRNKIYGRISKSISKLENINKIELYVNSLTGEIPPEIGSLALLQEIDISANKLVGKLPGEIANLKNLVVFQLYENKLSGEIPAGFGDLRKLVAFSIYRNNFTGEFPSNFGRFSPLNSIDISENQFSGAFPKFLCENRNLQFLLALENKFSGDFPNSYAECKSLQRFRINNNQFYGQIPVGLWALPFAKMIDFSDNNFTGGISPEIEQSNGLNQLLLKNNQFSGDLPPELGKLTSLEKLQLSGNKFSGEIPSDLGSLNQLSSLYLDNNSLTGEIPPELGNCERLVDLNLGRNSLTGKIPPSFSSMSSLNSLNLSMNKLTGSIPEYLEKMKLSSIDFSQNQFSGKVPADLLAVNGDKAFLGNMALCIDENHHLRLNSGLEICSEYHKNIFKNNLVFFCIIVSGLVLVLAGMVLFYSKLFKLHVHDMEADLGVEKEPDSKAELSSFHHVEFDFDEICNLEEANLIGSGGSGRVYRVNLRKNRGIVAVKQLSKGVDSRKVLDAEMAALGTIRHKNILKLYACLSKGGSNYLVFEYIVNGNLSRALQKRIKGEKPELDWYKRYKIALGAAKGIAYLHHDCTPPIVHRDIKSSNILLDENYEPKIADFGVAKIIEMSRKGSNFTNMMTGTPGYIAPELAYTLKVTEKSDVYSYGVTLLELVTGRGPIDDEEYGEAKDIVYWVVSHLNNHKNGSNVLDEVVLNEVVRDSMIKVLKIAILCTTKLPSVRPSMREVVKMLVEADPCSPRSPHGEPEENVHNLAKSFSS